MNLLIVSSSQEPPASYKATYGKMHPHYKTTPIISEFLNDDGHDVTLTLDAAVFASEDVKGYDAVVYNTTREGDLTLTGGKRQAPTRFIGGGGGFACNHYAGVRPESWPEYHDVTDGAWIRGVSTHQPYGDITITVSNADHPCAQGITDFTTKDELYVKLGYKPGNDVFMTAEYEGETWPMAWTRRYGNGRVFTSVLGHDAASFQAPALRRLIVNGVQWVTGQD